VNLRARLALTTLAVAFPIATGAAWVRGDAGPPPLVVRVAGARCGPRVIAPPRFAPVAVVLSVVLVALGPVVARIRRLTGAVRRSARGGYASSVAVEGDDEVAELARAFNDAAAEVREHVALQERRERALRAGARHRATRGGGPRVVDAPRAERVRRARGELRGAERGGRVGRQPSRRSSLRSMPSAMRRRSMASSPSASDAVTLRRRFRPPPAR